MDKREHSSNKENSHSQAIVMGLIAGGLLGIGSALLYGTKAGKELRRDFSEKAEDIKEDLLEKGEEFVDKIQNYKRPSSHSKTPTNLILGGIAGGILGSAAAFLLMDSSGKTFNETFQKLSSRTQEFADLIKSHSHIVSDEFKEKAEYWIKSAKTVLHALDEVFENVEKKKGHEKVAPKDHTVDDILELANIGIRLFQSFKKRS